MIKGRGKLNKGQSEIVTRQLLDEAVKTILGGMDNLFDKFKDEVEGFKNELKGELSELKVEVRGVKDDIAGLKADLSDTPTRKEFNDLIAKVDRFHPTS